MTTEDKPQKVLVITHGGWIMEMWNAINYINEKKKPVLNNTTRNCSINIFKMLCKNTKGICNKSCSNDSSCMEFEKI